MKKDVNGETCSQQARFIVKIASRMMCVCIYHGHVMITEGTGGDSVSMQSVVSVCRTTVELC